MTSRCLLSTSSYLSTFLRISKFCCSTWVWADRMARVTILDSIGISSGMLNRRGVEQPHQVVAEGQIELRQPRVALATGATAQLVVDPPGLVPLGAEHVEAAGSHHLLMLGGDRVLCLGQRIRPGGFVVLRRLHRRQPAVVQLGGGQELRVAAELHHRGLSPVSYTHL